MFISALRPDLTRFVTDRIRAAAEEQGRSRDDVKILAMLSVIVDETEEKAKAKYEEYKRVHQPRLCTGYHRRLVRC